MSGTTIGLANSYTYGRAKVQIFQTRQEMGVAAAQDAADLIKQAIQRHGRARIMVATGNSQLNLIEELTKQPGIAWKLVDVFHMDEYVGIDANHPASFRRWIRERLEERVHPASVNYIDGSATDLDAEIARYSDLLLAGPLDVAFVGFGENGHIAFNDPPTADFFDPLTVKRVILDEECQAQQVGEGHFDSLAAVPSEAITVSCPGLFRAEAWVSCVPELRKAEAVRGALTGPIATTCPASIVRTHSNATVYLDSDSASLLDR
jgi:glucosamine-6-phosphate deaminase